MPNRELRLVFVNSKKQSHASNINSKRIAHSSTDSMPSATMLDLAARLEQLEKIRPSLVDGISQVVDHYLSMNETNQRIAGADDLS